MRDEARFEEYVAARWSTFHRLALLLTGSDAGAQDLMQATMEKAYVAWPRICRMEAPDAYVRRIMVNALLSAKRRAWQRHEVTGVDFPTPVAPVTDHVLLDRNLLWPIVCALPQRQRAIIVLRYYEDLTEQEIAGVLGCSTGTVKSTAHDAMRALRRSVAAIATSGCRRTCLRRSGSSPPTDSASTPRGPRTRPWGRSPPTAASPSSTRSTANGAATPWTARVVYETSDGFVVSATDGGEAVRIRLPEPGGALWHPVWESDDTLLFQFDTASPAGPLTGSNGSLGRPVPAQRTWLLRCDASDGSCEVALRPGWAAGLRGPVYR
jgi:RNA polymerase sigma-70 factor (sigma-E family)